MVESQTHFLFSIRTSVIQIRLIPIRRTLGKQVKPSACQLLLTLTKKAFFNFRPSMTHLTKAFSNLLQDSLQRFDLKS
jgi:hypothetical protein